MQNQAVVSDTGELILQLPVNFAPGTPVTVLVIHTVIPEMPRKMLQPLKLGRHAAGLIKDDIYLGRETIYAKTE
jgi:hypothetical protein